MKGVILAGGKGSRLFPLTASVSKHLLPIYNKPLIYYPLSTLMLAGIREYLLIVTPEHEALYRKLFLNGDQFGIEINYEIQSHPEGIPSGLKLAESFCQNQNVALILGDNFFYGQGIGRSLKIEVGDSAKIFVKEMSDVSNFGVLEVDKYGNPLNIVEKPSNSNSNLAVTGIYFYPNAVFNKINQLKKSSRGETEISDLNNLFLSENKLTYNLLPRSTVWLDTGSFDGISSASEFVRIIEKQQGINIGDPKEIAKSNGWIP